MADERDKLQEWQDVFWSYVDKTDTCWLWTGNLSLGYGMFGYLSAHRVAYTTAKGRIPRGLHIDHLCRVKNCVNPAHLEAVTNSENKLRHLRWVRSQGTNAWLAVGSNDKSVLIKVAIPLELRSKYVSKIEARIEKSDSCWIWIGRKDRDGYGRLYVPVRRAVFAHRASYEVFRGDIPVGCVLDHVCRNESCVNPDHLDPVSQATNSRRSRMAKLTEKDVESIRCSPDIHTVEAAKYGVHPSTVCDIRLGNRWA